MKTVRGLLLGCAIALSAHASAQTGERTNNATSNNLMILGFALGLIAVVSYFRMRRSQERTALLRLMVERGQPIAPELLLGVDDVRAWRIRTGATLILLGAALSFCVWNESRGGPNWVWGLMPISVGVGMLATSMLGKRSSQ